MELDIRKRMKIWPRSGNKSFCSGTIFKLEHFYQFFFGFASLMSGQFCNKKIKIFFQPNANDILKYRVIVSIAYEVPGTEQKDLQQFAEKLKR